MQDGDELARRELEYKELKRMLKALGDVVRLNMVHLLAGRKEMNVTDLTLALQPLAQEGHLITQPLVSWHLSKLRREGLVRTRRYGRLVYCSLDAARYQRCLRLLGEVVSSPASSDPTTESSPAFLSGGTGMAGAS